MSGGAKSARQRRWGCGLCKMYKRQGNGKDRRTHTEQKAPTVRSELEHLRSW